MEVVIDSEGVMPHEESSIFDLLITSIDEGAKEREERQQEQDELQERALRARDVIYNVDWGKKGEFITPSRAGIRRAHRAFRDQLAELVVNPNSETLVKAKIAHQDLERERQTFAAVVAARKAEAQEQLENEFVEVPVISRHEVSFEDLAHPNLKQVSLKRSERLKEKRDDVERRRLHIYVGRMRAAGKEKEAEAELLAALLDESQRAITEDQYNQAISELKAPFRERKQDPRYFCRRGQAQGLKADVNAAFASRKIKTAPQPEDDEKKKAKKKATQGGAASDSQGQKGGKRK